MPFPDTSAARGDREAPLTENCGVCDAWRCLGLTGHHSHLEVEPGRILRSGRYFLRETFPTWQSLQHVFIEFLGPSQASIQAAAVARWDYYRQCVGLTIDTVETEELIYLFNIFDDYFFRGTLKRWTAVIWADYDRGRSGSTTLYTHASVPYVIITIHRPPRPGGVGDCSHDDPSEIIATLLHEMCHAIFELYVCRSCCKASGPGLTGHGVAWLSLAFAVQEGVKRSFEGLGNLSLDVADDSVSVQDELDALGRHGMWRDRRRVRRRARANGGKTVY